MISLFYPASLLLHKNHAILFDPRLLKFIDYHSVHIYLTVDPIFDLPSQYLKYFTFLGRISHKDSLKLMSSCDGLLYLSSYESLGLPLIEATFFDKPIICPLKNYSLELLGSSAYYFQLDSIDSLISALYSFLSCTTKITSSLKSPMVPIAETITIFSSLIS